MYYVTTNFKLGYSSNPHMTPVNVYYVSESKQDCINWINNNK